MQLFTLKPKNPKGKRFHTVRIIIDKTKKQIIGAVLFSRGSKTSFTVKTLETNQDIPDAAFTFDAKTHPGVNVINLCDE